jgi:hypothetical protein
MVMAWRKKSTWLSTKVIQSETERTNGLQIKEEPV